MKRTFQFLALVAICSAMMISCKNAKTTEPTSEEIQAQKVAMADSVLAIIDEIAEKDIALYGQEHNPIRCVLSDKEKLIKPDYLLDLKVVDTLVTRQQKINALGILVIDLVVRIIYDMPTEGSKEAIGKLAAELNIPFNTSEINGEKLSEKCRSTYEAMKANGDVDLYWKFQRAAYVTSNYILSRDPELFFSKVSPDVWDTFVNRAKCLGTAIMAISSENPTFMPESTVELYKNSLSVYEKHSSIEESKAYYIQEKDILEKRYKSLLQ